MYVVYVINNVAGFSGLSLPFISTEFINIFNEVLISFIAFDAMVILYKVQFNKKKK